MPRPRIAMRKIREVLRLVLGEGLSRNRAATATGVPYATVADCLSRATVAPSGRDGRPGSGGPAIPPGVAPDGPEARSRTGLRSTGSCGARG